METCFTSTTTDISTGEVARLGRLLSPRDVDPDLGQVRLERGGARLGEIRFAIEPEGRTLDSVFHLVTAHELRVSTSVA